MSEAVAAASAPSAQPSSNPFHNPAQNPSNSNENVSIDNPFEGLPGEIVDSEADKYTPKTIKAKPQDKSKPTEKQVQQAIEEIQLKSGKYTKEQIEEFIEHRANMDRGAYAKMQEAAKIRKEAETYKQNVEQQIVKYLKENPRELFKAAGMDFEEVAFNELNQKVKQLQMTPEQREIENLKEQVRQSQARAQQEQLTKQQQQEQLQQQQFEQEVTVAEQTLQDQFIKAYEKSGLPPNQRFARWMAADLADYYDAGIEIPVEFVAQKAYDEFRNDFVTIASKMDEQQLRKFMPKPLMQKISQIVASEFSNSTEFQNKIKPKRTEAPTFERKQKYLSYSDVDEMRKQGKI